MTKKVRNWSLITGVIVFLVVFFVFVLGPLVEKINKVQQKMRASELEVKESLRVQVQKEEIIEEYKKYESYLKQAGISERERIGNFLKELERISQEANLSVISLNPSEVVEEAQSVVYSADFKAEGGMEEVLFFFNKIQESKLLIRVDDFSLSPKDKTATGLKLDVKVGMSLPRN